MGINNGGASNIACLPTWKSEVAIAPCPRGFAVYGSCTTFSKYLKLLVAGWKRQKIAKIVVHNLSEFYPTFKINTKYTLRSDGIITLGVLTRRKGAKLPVFAITRLPWVTRCNIETYMYTYSKSFQPWHSARTCMTHANEMTRISAKARLRIMVLTRDVRRRLTTSHTQTRLLPSAPKTIWT